MVQFIPFLYISKLLKHIFNYHILIDVSPTVHQIESFINLSFQILSYIHLDNLIATMLNIIQQPFNYPMRSNTNNISGLITILFNLAVNFHYILLSYNTFEALIYFNHQSLTLEMLYYLYPYQLYINSTYFNIAHQDIISHHMN